MITKLNCGVSKFTNILHVADIHILLTKRHTEYTEVFKNLYKAIEKTPDTTAVCVVGDVFHSKSDLSPECVEIASQFLKNLADLRPTILTAGNHDATLTNKNRLDSLSPIVNAIKHPNLFYLKDTGIYQLGDILFNNFSVFDEHSPENYIPFDKIPKIYVNNASYFIGLYHGPIDSAVTDIGYKVTSSTKNELFDGHQIILLGDIHRHQILQNYHITDDKIRKPVVVYSGSLIQRNHGEELKGHGFVYWDLKTLKFKHVEVKNDYGYFTVEIDRGTLVTDLTDIPKKTTLRIKAFESVATELKSVISEIRKHTEIVDINYLRVDQLPSSVNNSVVPSLNIHGLSNISYQNKLIAEYLQDKHTHIPDSLIRDVEKINKELNDLIVKDLTAKNIRWKPKRFEFDNMFSYGEGNVIDFSKMKDVVGLFAANASGKSSILSALSFCIFDKCDRAFKAVHVMNTQKMSFKCKFNFEIDKVDYFIERIGHADKKGSVKVDVRFWKEENGKMIELNGEARRNTNDLIRDYVGTYDDFILTVLSIQNSKTGSFIDLGQTERKDLLAQFMGLTIFDKLHGLANDKMREWSVLMKNFAKTDYNAELETLTTNITNTESVIRLKDDELKTLMESRDVENEKIEETTKQLIKVNVTTTDVAGLESQHINTDKKIISEQLKYDTEVPNIEKLKNDIKPINDKVEKFKSDDIESKYSEYNTLKLEASNIEGQLERKKLIVTTKLDKLKKLENHKYDPNCTYCVNNVFVQDAIKTKEDLENDKIEAKGFIEKLNGVKNKLSVVETIANQYQEYRNLVNSLSALTKNISNLENLQLQRENTIVKEKNVLELINNKIKEYYDSKDAIESNIKVQKVIDDIKSNIKNVDFNIRTVNGIITDAKSKINNWNYQKSQIEAKIAEMKETEKIHNAYTYYVDAVSRDGLQYQIISKALPGIESEVNNILNQIVEFTISFQTDGKNIMAYIVYEDKKWPLELASGLEKFVSSLAIRVSLINVSNLPRPNFIAIDEGFGCADSDHLSAMSNLFSFLKNTFDFVWIVSHLDVLKDMVDTRLEIVKDDGFSRINFQ